LVTVSELKDQLEAAGIACFMNNEVSAQLFPDVPRNESTPEVWIEDDSRLDEALKIKADWLSPRPPDAPAWTCPKCGEKSEAQFTSCWKCGTARP
jgi:hypothetical protein